MIINRQYVLERIEELIHEKQAEEVKEQSNKDRLYRIKLKFPKWLRNMVFHPYNPAYSIYLQNKARKKNDKSRVVGLTPLHPQAVDFVKYCLISDFEFNTAEYYSESDNGLVVSMIVNRLKSVLGGYGTIRLNEEQQVHARQYATLKAQVKKSGEKYMLKIDGTDYYLPNNSFSGQTYIHHYGLKFLPDYVKEYINDKVFLDFGAYVGDASILFAKQYKPQHLYAYEPMPDTAAKLLKTISYNSLDCVTIVNKGVGDKVQDIDIFVDADYMSTCSINDSLVKESTQKQKISITTIDNDCKDMNVGLIKMDIEGAEYAAIKGALETIKRDKPVLLISMYHTGKDFFEIPPMLKQVVPEYTFRLLDLECHYPIAEKILAAYLPHK